MGLGIHRTLTSFYAAKNLGEGKMGGKRHYTAAFGHLTPTPNSMHLLIYSLSLSLSQA
jgi:hypothetical protein